MTGPRKKIWRDLPVAPVPHAYLVRLDRPAQALFDTMARLLVAGGPEAGGERRRLARLRGDYLRSLRAIEALYVPQPIFVETPIV